jgi:hypothetical protein
MLQLIEMSLSSIGNINGIFQTLQTPIDPFFFLQQYVPFIDWEEFKSRASEYALTQATKTDIDNTNAVPGEVPPGGGK